MEPKNWITLFGFAFLVFLGCQKEEKEDAPNDHPIHGTWYMVNISGGFAGINSNFDKGEIVWYFDADHKTLEVQINSSANSIFNGLPTGNYSYSIFEDDGHSYLVVENREIGGIAIAQDEMKINQNDISVGVGADRYIFKLVR